MMIPKLGKKWLLVGAAALFSLGSGGIVTKYLPWSLWKYYPWINGFLSVFSLLFGLYAVYLKVTAKAKAKTTKINFNPLTAKVITDNNKDKEVK